MTLAEKMAKFKNAAGKIDTDEPDTAALATRETLPLKDKMQVNINLQNKICSIRLIRLLQLFVREQAVENAEKSNDDDAFKVC